MNVCKKPRGKNGVMGYMLICACIAMLAASLLPNKLIMLVIFILLVLAWLCLF